MSHPPLVVVQVHPVTALATNTVIVERGGTPSRPAAHLTSISRGLPREFAELVSFDVGVSRTEPVGPPDIQGTWCSTWDRLVTGPAGFDANFRSLRVGHDRGKFIFDITNPALRTELGQWASTLPLSTTTTPKYWSVHRETCNLDSSFTGPLRYCLTADSGQWFQDVIFQRLA